MSTLNAQSDMTQISTCPDLLAEHQDAQQASQLDQHSIADVARCHVQMLDNLQAARWYEKIADLDDCDPQYLLEYGQCLKSLKLYGKAKFYFQKYATHHPVEGNQFMQSCDIAKMMLESEQLYQVTAWNNNSIASEFAPWIVNDKMIYCNWSAGTNTPVLTGCSIQGSMPQPYNPGIPGAGDMAHLRYANNAKCAVYSKNHFKAGQRLLPQTQGTSLYFTEMMSTQAWSAPAEMPFSNASSIIGYPAISEDGTQIFFASTMPGGQGGWDIYMSSRTGDTWSKPENLGKGINTPGNEISPFVSDNKLYFSSDWHIGIGGFDVFVAMHDESGFGDVRNVGFPVNSPKDDLDFIVDVSTGSAYFSSNRIGGVGQYDIYKATPQFREIEVSVMHKESLKPVQNAALTVSPGTTMAYYTNTSGAAKLLQPLTGDREIIVKKDGFKEQKVRLNSTNAYQVYLEPAKTTSSQPGEVKVVQDEKPVKNAQQVVNAPLTEKPTATVVTTNPVNMKQMYFIQIAALARNASLEPYSALSSYGDLLVHENGMYAKVRLGTFATEAEAKLVLARIKTEGYPDAFVVKQAVDVNTKAQHVSATSEYKVRLGTYAKVGNFNPDLVTHLGSIESYRKDELTIMLLAGYSSLKAAQKARDAAASQGFTDAYVVMDNGGVFERVR